MSKPNIHKYPSGASPETLAKYQIAVMQAAADGQPVESKSRFSPDREKRWKPITGPLWNWSSNNYRIAEPKIAEGRNPGRVTEEQLGEGYRLLTEEERVAIHGGESIHVTRGDIEMWCSGSWLLGIDGGADLMTYRTKFPVNYFTKEARALWDALGEIPSEKLVNLARQRMKEGESVDAHDDSPSWEDALSRAFSWSGTPEGASFWVSVHDEDWGGLPVEYRPAKEEPKTLRQLLDEELPRSIATAAFRNLRKEGKVDVDAVYEENECIGNLSPYSDLLRFVWDDTPEGFDFWLKVRGVLVNTEWTAKDPHDGPFPPYPETIDPATGVSLSSDSRLTYEEWFRGGLPKKIADLAMANSAPLLASSLRPQDLGQALSSGFTWINTPQGVEFWKNVYRAADDPRNPWPEVPEISEVVEKKLRPWKSEEVPLPCVFRRKGRTHGMRFTGLLAQGDGVCVGAYAGGTAPHNSQSYKSLLEHWEHSVDHGKTWEPCGTLE